MLATSDSALLKHEVCYVLGQIQEEGNDARAALRATLENAREHPMVRHEAAEAIGSIAAEDTEALLLKFRDDQDRIVAESCEVALDIMQSEISGEFVPLVVEAVRAAASTRNLFFSFRVSSRDLLATREFYFIRAIVRIARFRSLSPACPLTVQRRAPFPAPDVSSRGRNQQRAGDRVLVRTALAARESCVSSRALSC